MKSKEIERHFQKHRTFCDTARREEGVHDLKKVAKQVEELEADRDPERLNNLLFDSYELIRLMCSRKKVSLNDTVTVRPANSDYRDDKHIYDYHANTLASIRRLLTVRESLSEYMRQEDDQEIYDKLMDLYEKLQEVTHGDTNTYRETLISSKPVKVKEETSYKDYDTVLYESSEPYKLKFGNEKSYRSGLRNKETVDLFTNTEEPFMHIITYTNKIRSMMEKARQRLNQHEQDVDRLQEVIDNHKHTYAVKEKI